jgi:hypothetical protein
MRRGVLPAKSPDPLFPATKNGTLSVYNSMVTNIIAGSGRGDLYIIGIGRRVNGCCPHSVLLTNYSGGRLFITDRMYHASAITMSMMNITHKKFALGSLV